MDLICSICHSDLDIVTKWPRLIPNTGDTICQICVGKIVDHSIEFQKIQHLQNDLIQLAQLKCNNLKMDDFPLNQSLLRILQTQKHKQVKQISFEQKILNNQTFDEWNSEETSIDSNFLEDIATSIKKPPKKRYSDHDESFVSLNYSSHSPLSKVCQAHRRPLEVVCLQCQQMVCTNCALFGAHKGHYIHSEEDVISLLEMKATELTDLIENVVKESFNIDKEKYENELNNKIDIEYQRLIDKIGLEFSNLRKQVEAKEKQIYGTISLIHENIKGNWFMWWNQHINIDQESKQWIHSAQSIFDRFTDPQTQSKYWDLLNLTEQIQNRGLTILQEIKRNEASIKIKMDTLLGEEINIKFNPSCVKIDEFCKINEQQQQQQQQQQNESTLLLASFQIQQQNSIEETDLLHDVRYEYKIYYFSANFGNNNNHLVNNEQLFFKTQTSEQMQNLIPKPNYRGFRSATPKDKQQENNDPYSLSPIMKQDQSRMSTSRKRSQIPLKIQLYMDELKKGKHDVAEFQNLDLAGNDQILQTVCNEIKYWKIKQLKLMKSRITDDNLVNLIRAINCNDNLVSINLSQNCLSDKSVEYIYQFCNSGLINSQLKNIIVSQNKINARNVKSKIAEIKKLGLTVTL